VALNCSDSGVWTPRPSINNSTTQAIVGSHERNRRGVDGPGDGRRRNLFRKPRRRTPAARVPQKPGIACGTLQGQHAAYIELQLATFAPGMRQNDVNRQMRTIAKQLTPAEMHAIAVHYSSNGRARTAKRC
jgi:hypothetical protein